MMLLIVCASALRVLVAPTTAAQFQRTSRRTQPTPALRGVSVSVIIRKMARASRSSLSFEKIRLIILLLLAVALVGVWRDVPILRKLTVSRVVFAAARRLTYTTNFPLTENPVSEGGQWINGRTVGVDWSDIATTPGLAYGLESGFESGSRGYDDAVALLNGKWGPDQTAEATVHSVNQNDEVYEEVELRLRSSLSAHRATGYEINFRCSKTTKAYSEIVRWNGPLGSFTYLSQRSGSQYGVTNGDVVKATIVGNVITAYINGVQVNQATDNTYPTGNPGMGFFLQGTAGVNRDYGFSTFAASDGSP